MAVTTEACALGLLAFCWTVVSLVAQDTGCSSLKTPFVVSNLGNLSVGMSDIGYLRDYALRPLLAQPRVSGTYGSDVARTHIKTWMSAAGWTVKEDSFYDYTPYGSRRFSNVIATLSPGKSRRVVLACHYDSKLMPTVRFVGAIDSAVPCSLLMDSAFRLRGFLNTSISSSSDLTLQFIFFDGEEAFVTWTQQDSLYGARHLASKWASTPDPGTQGLDNYLRSIETFILLDLIGTPDTHFKMRFQQTAPVYYQLQSVESCLRDSGHLTSTQYPGPLFTSQRDFSVIEDDHIPFWQRRVPIVHLITSPFPSVWHTARDDLQALDFNRIDNLARVLRVFLMNLPLW